MVSTLPDDVENMVNNEASVLFKHGQQMCEYTPGHNLQRQPHCHKLRNLAHNHKLQQLIPTMGWSMWRLLTSRKCHPAVLTLREAEEAGNSSDVYAYQQLPM
jgi:hypothetical protein